MKITKTKFEGLVIIEPTVYGDERGYFFESYAESALAAEGIDLTFVQDNEAMSTKGVLRGLHYQTNGMGQAKLVRVSQGEVLDVAVDIRPQSATYGQHISLVLNDITKKQMLVPAGFAHGYIVLSDTAVFQYKCDKPYSPEDEAGILYSDPALSIDWILPAAEYTVSAKDIAQPLLADHKPYV